MMTCCGALLGCTTSQVHINVRLAGCNIMLHSALQPGGIKLGSGQKNIPDVAVCCVVNGQTASQGASLLCYSQ